MVRSDPPPDPSRSLQVFTAPLKPPPGPRPFEATAATPGPCFHRAETRAHPPSHLPPSSLPSHHSSPPRVMGRGWSREKGPWVVGGGGLCYNNWKVEREPLTEALVESLGTDKDPAHCWLSFSGTQNREGRFATKGRITLR